MFGCNFSNISKNIIHEKYTLISKLLVNLTLQLLIPI